MSRSASRAAVTLFLSLAALLAALPAAAVPQVAIGRFPRGIMQPVGGVPETDTFTVANVGAEVATIRIVGIVQAFRSSGSRMRNVVPAPGAPSTAMAPR